MNRREEDRLIEMMFGDLDAKDSALLKHKVESDPSLSAQAKEWADLREDLKGLRDIPEMQFSNERLREAILGSGLKPEPATAPWWQFAWMPLAAGIAVLMVLPLMNRGKQAPLILTDNTVASQSELFGGSPKLNKGAVAFNSAPTDVIKAPTSVRLDSPAASSSAPTGSKPAFATRTTTKKRTKLRFTLAKYASTAKFDAKVKVTPAILVSTKKTEINTFDSAQNSATRSETAVSEPARQDDSVILIDSVKDTNTGSPTATEVGTINNVIVGG